MKFFISLIILITTTVTMAAPQPRDAYDLVKAGKAIMIDVREKDEIASGMIEKAVWFPKSKIESDTTWKKDFETLTSGKQIFLYCRSGRRSGEVQKILKTNGIKSENIGGYETLKTLLPVSHAR